MEIRRISAEYAADLKLKNEPFSMPGRFVPSLKDGIWNYHLEQFEDQQSMVFPEEDYDFEALERNSIIFGAYEDGQCIGLAIYQKGFFKYLYLYDLKVCASFRGKGVGKALIAAGCEASKQEGYIGIYTQAQDNNLNACMFYLQVGFQIGGFDNRGYDGTSQEGKADVIFYLRTD